MSAPLGRVPDGRPQSGGGACTDFHGTPMVKGLSRAQRNSTVAEERRSALSTTRSTSLLIVP